MYLVVSASNSQKAASISSGSAQIPLVHSLSSGLGNSRYLKLPAAMAIRYDGIGIG